MHIYQAQGGCHSSDIAVKSFWIEEDDWNLIKAIVFAAKIDGKFNKVPAIKAGLLVLRRYNPEFPLLHAKEAVEAAYNEM